MSTKLEKGTYGYLNRNKISAWKKSLLMLSVPIIIFLAAWTVSKTRNNVMTVVAIVGCLPGCNQIVRAIMASRYHSIDRSLYEETEKARGDRLALYENVFTSYEQTYSVDCAVISGRDIVGYSSDERMDAGKAQEHIRGILKNNSYKQNVKIFKDRKAFLDRVRTLSAGEPEKVPFREDERCPHLTRDEVIRYLLMSISL